jgi:hypothetical protein
VTRGVDDLLADLAEAADAAAERARLGSGAGTLSTCCGSRERLSSADWATLPPGCPTRSSRLRLRLPGGRSRA